MKTLSEITQLLTDLVRIPSVNPASDGVSSAHAGEGRMVDYLERLLKPWADGVERQEVAPGRDNLIARFDGPCGSPTYAMDAHTDTVAVTGMTIDPFAAELREGRLYGRGACDTKGPMAAMLAALISARKESSAFSATWYFIASCDEELGGLGAKNLVDRGFACDGIIVAEPTGLAVIDAHKGAARYRVCLRGRAAHSAHPELGLHAIHAAAAFISAVEAENLREAARHAQNRLGPPTLSVGTIRGGDQVNRIPDIVVMELDVRLLPEQSAAHWTARLQELLEAVVAQRPELHYKLEPVQSYPGFALERRSPFGAVAETLATEAGNGFACARYATNGGFYAEGGIPCVVFGPGSISQAHTADEWVDLAEVVRAAEIYKRLIQNSAHIPATL